MGILRADRVAGLGGANAINGSVFFGNGLMGTAYDSIKTEPSSDFIMGTGDFTLEGWFYLGNVTQNWQALIADTLYGGTGGWTFYVNTNQLNFWKGGASVVSGGTLTANTWHHLAFSRASGSNRLFVDGALVATASDSTNYTSNSASHALFNIIHITNAKPAVVTIDRNHNFTNGEEVLLQNIQVKDIKNRPVPILFFANI